MKSSSTSILCFSLLLSLLSLSSAQPITKAAGILYYSGFNIMAASLDLASDTFTATATATGSPYLTVFAPADAAFSSADYPTPDLLRYHLVGFHLESLQALPSGATIKTLAGYSLTVTTLPGDRLSSLNNIRVTSSTPIFDDGSLVVYPIEDFFPRRLGSIHEAHQESPPPTVVLDPEQLQRLLEAIRPARFDLFLDTLLTTSSTVCVCILSGIGYLLLDFSVNYAINNRVYNLVLKRRAQAIIKREEEEARARREEVAGIEQHELGRIGRTDEPDDIFEDAE